MNLKNKLQSLNSAETQSGIWVNPENPLEEYRIGQFVFENGGMLDDWVCIGSLDKLSFGFQSTEEAFCEAATKAMGDHKFDKEALYEAFCEERLPDELQEKIQEEIEIIHEVWSENLTDDFVDNELPRIIEEFKEESKLSIV